MIYSIPYIIFLGFLCVLAVIASEKKDDEELCRNINRIGIGAFILFFGFRGYIWHDWTVYAEEFAELSFSDIFNYDYLKHREPLWLIYSLICKSVFDSYYFFALVSTLINTILLVRFFKVYSISVLFALATYVAFSGFEISINLMRNSMALFIVLNALPYIEERKFGKYLLACCIAMGLHLSSIMYIPLYFILHRKFNKWVFLAVVLIANAVLFSNISIVLRLIEGLGFSNEILDQKLESYVGFGMSAGSRFVLLQRFLLCMMVFCYYDRLQEMSKSNHLFINALMLYTVGVYFTSEFSELSNRIGILFSFSFWILAGYLVKCCFYINNRRLFIGFIGFVLMFNTFVNTREEIKKYENWLLGTADSYNEKVSFFNRKFKERKQIESGKE